jgi:hypothetical protein
VDIKIVEAYLKRVIKAADMMLATIEAGNGTPEQLVGNMQIAGKHYNIAKKLFVVAAREFHKHKDDCNRYHQEIYSEDDRKYYEAMDESVQ